MKKTREFVKHELDRLDTAYWNLRWSYDEKHKKLHELQIEVNRLSTDLENVLEELILHQEMWKELNPEIE